MINLADAHWSYCCRSVRTKISCATSADERAPSVPIEEGGCGCGRLARVLGGQGQRNMCVGFLWAVFADLWGEPVDEELAGAGVYPRYFVLL